MKNTIDKREEAVNRIMETLKGFSKMMLNSKIIHLN